MFKKIRYLIGDVRDYRRNLDACDGVDIIIHAAAMKHVDICEYNKGEAIKTNFNGTNALLRAAIKKKVKNFYLLALIKLLIQHLLWVHQLLAEKSVLKKIENLNLL